jgi:hypothetical protein
MKAKKLVWIAILMTLALLALALVLPGTASAGAIRAEGEWWYKTVDAFYTRIPSGNTLFTGSETGRWTGTFQGSSVEPFQGVIFADGRARGLITAKFTGTIDGVWSEAVIMLTVNWPAGKDPYGQVGGHQRLQGAGTLERNGNLGRVLRRHERRHGHLLGDSLAALRRQSVDPT